MECYENLAIICTPAVPFVFAVNCKYEYTKLGQFFIYKLINSMRLGREESTFATTTMPLPTMYTVQKAIRLTITY